MSNGAVRARLLPLRSLCAVLPSSSLLAVSVCPVLFWSVLSCSFQCSSVTAA